jgi:uncharacterized membrane protein
MRQIISAMHKGRLEAFSDGVFAIIITIMVLELRAPHGAEIQLIFELAPVFLSYVLSFIFVGIYWNNHHHLMQATQKINGFTLWANLHLLFWLSLLPFTTAWMGENNFAQWPVALYGLDLLLCGVAYYILVQNLIRHHGRDSTLVKAVGSDFKGKISVVIYAIAIPLTYVNSWWAYGLYILVALMWLIPDRRIEDKISAAQGK